MLCEHTLSGVPAWVCDDNEDDLFFCWKGPFSGENRRRKDCFRAEASTIDSFFRPFLKWSNLIWVEAWNRIRHAASVWMERTHLCERFLQKSFKSTQYISWKICLFTLILTCQLRLHPGSSTGCCCPHVSFQSGVKLSLKKKKKTRCKAWNISLTLTDWRWCTDSFRGLWVFMGSGQCGGCERHLRRKGKIMTSLSYRNCNL